MERLRTEVLGKVGGIVMGECSVAVAGTSTLGIAGVLGVSIPMLTTSTTLGVFVLSGLHLPSLAVARSSRLGLRMKSNIAYVCMYIL